MQELVNISNNKQVRCWGKNTEQREMSEEQ